MAKPGRAERLAEAIVYKTIVRETKAAVKEAVDKTHGKGCMCSTCVHSAAARANSWVEMTARGRMDTTPFTFEVVTTKTGKQKLVRGNQEEE